MVVLPYMDKNQPWVDMCPHPEPHPPPPSPSHPSGSSQCTSPERPVSCTEPGLVIYFTYDNIHVSMLFSQIIPPSPSPTEPKICSLHLCLFCCVREIMTSLIYHRPQYSMCIILIIVTCFFFLSRKNWK